MRPAPMDCADPTVLKPRNASPLTTGEYTGVGLSDSARAVCIDKNRQKAKKNVPVHNPDMVELKRNIQTPFELVTLCRWSCKNARFGHPVNMHTG